MFEKQTIENTRKIDEYCDRYETNFGRDSHVPLREAIQSWPSAEQKELLAALLPLELELRARNEDWPSEKEYLAELSSFEEQVTDAFQEFYDWATSSGRISAKTPGAETSREALETQRIEGELLRSASKEIPSRMGRYFIERELGTGGMGRVLLAQDEVLNRQVAIKLPHFDLDKDTRSIERFFREAQSMASLRHPNICPVYDVGETDGYHYITMAYIEGQTLAEPIKDALQMPARAIAELMLKLARAIQYSHDAGVLHRDLKPSNVLLDGNGEPYVTDFGLALCECQEETNLTQSGAIIGSPAYMAPEQVGGEREKVGPACDVYSLGVVFYELLSGRRPFKGNSLEILGQITSGKAPEPPSAHQSVDFELERICLKAMAHRMEDRYVSASALAVALEDYLGTSSPGSVQTSVLPKKESSSAASRVLLAVAGLVAMLLVAFGISFLQPNADKAEAGPERGPEPLASFPVPPPYRMAERYLLEGSPLYRASLGVDVAMDGEIAVVGANGGYASQLPTGMALLFEKEESGGTTSWRQTEVLRPRGERPQLYAFGTRVAVSGDRIAVAAPNRTHESSGCAYIFGKTGSGWQLEQKIEAPEETVSFGLDVCITNDYVAVLALSSSGREVVHLFRREDTATWSLVQTLDTGSESKGVGALDMEGNELVLTRVTPVSVDQKDVSLELVVFHLRDGLWEEANSLPLVSAYLGKHCLDLHGQELVVGLSNFRTGCGVVRYYRKDAQENWLLEQTLEAETPDVSAKFGHRVAIGGNRIMVSTNSHVPDGELRTKDNVTVFQRSSDGWQLEKTWTKEDQLGHRLAASALAVGPSGESMIGAYTADGGSGQLHSIDAGGETNQVTVSLPDQPICPFDTLFGQGLAVTGSHIAVSAKFYSHASRNRSGQIQVLSREGDGSVKLFSQHPTLDGYFGELVLLEENTLIGGGKDEVQVFEKVDGEWTAGQVFHVEGDLEYHFGHAGCLWGDWLAVSVEPRQRRLSDPLAGTEYSYVDMYRRSNGRWEYTQRLQAQDAVPMDAFGCSISIQNDELVVGAFRAAPHGKESGAAYVFRLVGNRWQQQQKLTASNGGESARFGSQVDLDGNMLAVSADRESTFGKHSGAVYVFQREGDEWKQLPEIVYPRASSQGSYFGSSIDLSGNRLLVGAREEGREEFGAAYLFYSDGQSWIQHQKFSPPGALYKQHFGGRVVMAGDSLFVAADGENDGAGAIYVLEPAKTEESAVVSGPAE